MSETKCQRCSGCEGEDHHPLYESFDGRTFDVDDPHHAAAVRAFGGRTPCEGERIAIVVCKHCDWWEHYDGDNPRHEALA